MEHNQTEEDSDPYDMYETFQLLVDDHPMKPGALNFCGHLFLKKFKSTQSIADSQAAIKAFEEAVNLLSADDSRFGSFLADLGSVHYERYKSFRQLSDIQAAIEKCQLAIAMAAEEDEELSTWLINLGAAFHARFERTGELRDISESIKHQQRAVELALGGHRDLAYSEQHAIRLTAEGDEDLPTLLNNLANTFLQRSERTGELTDVLEAITLQQRALQMIPEGRADLPTLLDNLGNSLFQRFEHSGDLEDISESIQLRQRAIRHTPNGHEDPRRLNNLGNSFLRRFDQFGAVADLAESIQLQHRAVQLTPNDHPEMPTLLDNLGRSFQSRFKLTRQLEDSSKAIELHQLAIELTPRGHDEDHRGQFNNLGNAFLQRFEQTRELADISNSIQFHRRAIEFAQEGHAVLPELLNNLAGSLLYRFEQTGELQDISESIQHYQRSVELTSKGHPILSARLDNLGKSFLAYFERTQTHEAFDEALLNFRLSAMASTGPPTVFLSAAKSWANLCRHPPTPLPPSELLSAHERIIHLISLIAGIEGTLERRHSLLVEISPLSNAAAAAALSVNRSDKAVEWLEQGRCVVWSQINQLRAPLDDLRAEDTDLADRLLALSRKLETTSSRSVHSLSRPELPLDVKISWQDDAQRHLKLAKERDELLATVRNIPGFRDFLLPQKFVDLTTGLSDEGPVVILNVDKDRCDALALIAGFDEPVHIPLTRFSREKASALAEGLGKYLSSRQLRSRYSELSKPVSEPHSLGTYRGMRVHSGSDIKHLLQALWIDVVQPILQALAFEVPEEGDELPRIWWCPTGPFAFLPIHAAGIYGRPTQNPGSCLADYAVSSYIPSLSILERLKFRASNATNQGVLLVSQPDTPGLSRIPGTVLEVQKAHDELNKHGIRTALMKSKDATVDTISESLSSFSCVHLACHASQDIRSPLQSAIHLYDGPLKTSTGIEVLQLPEEAVHVAAGMLAAGYGRVVGTMWSIADRHAPQVAEAFYQNLLTVKEDEEGPSTIKGKDRDQRKGNGKSKSKSNSGRAECELDVTASARALHIATRRLREQSGDSTDALLAWIPYVHFGS